MRPLLLIASGLCALLMLGGMWGYTYEDSMTDIAVPPGLNEVGFAESPLTESAIPSALISAELTISWDENVWLGLITEEEYERCSPNSLAMSDTCKPDSTNFAAGGPSTGDEKTFTYEISDEVYYPVDGQKSGGLVQSVDVEYSVHVTLAWPVIFFLGLLGTGLQVLAQRMH